MKIATIAMALVLEKSVCPWLHMLFVQCVSAVFLCNTLCVVVYPYLTHCEALCCLPVLFCNTLFTIVLFVCVTHCVLLCAICVSVFNKLCPCDDCPCSFVAHCVSLCCCPCNTLCVIVMFVRVTHCVLLSKICETYCVFAFNTLFSCVAMFLIVWLLGFSVTQCVLLCGRTGWTPDYGCGRPEKPRPARAAKRPQNGKHINKDWKY